MDQIGLILKALEMAAHRHRYQVRKGIDRFPYINHPIQVANLLANEAGEKDPVLLAAAILHDVIEDTVVSESEKKELMDQISKIFGDEILSLTLEVTDDNSLEKEERKRIQIVEASSKSVNAKKLKIADKVLNVQDMTLNPPVGWPVERILEYFDWAEQVIAGLRGVNQQLEDMFDEAIKKGRAKYTLR